MHMSDGIVDAPTSVIFGVIAVAAIGLCAVKARSELDERTVPLAGLVAAFIFAVQMVNFPILPGVSGHLLGGALAAILVGPYTGALCIAIVLIVQSLLFADGGITALGTNITNMAARRRRCGVCDSRRSLRGRAAARRPMCRWPGSASSHSSPHCSERYARQWRSSSNTPSAAPAPRRSATVAAYMLGTHALIGIGEGVITAVTVMAVARSRPDLVYLKRDARAEVPA